MLLSKDTGLNSRILESNEDLRKISHVALFLSASVKSSFGFTIHLNNDQSNE